MQKRGISKNYFHFDPPIGDDVFDQRLVETCLEKGKRPEKSALGYKKIETKIVIYEDRVKEWFLEIARKLGENNEAMFVILQIAVSYIEGNQQYIEGENSKNNSKSFFKRGLKRIFKLTNTPENLIDSFYDQVRCGLFHDGFTKKDVTISKEFSKDLEINEKEIKINPKKFLDTVYKDFKRYIRKLKNKKNKELRTKFKKRCNIIDYPNGRLS